MTSVSLTDMRQRLLSDDGGVLTHTRARLARLARARGVAPDAVDDVTQETLAEAWRLLDRLTAPEGFAYWVDEICRNICRRYAQRAARESAHLARLPYGEEGQDEERVSWVETVAAEEDPALDLIESAPREEMCALLDRALGLLPDETRRLVELIYLREVPHAEVAARLGVTAGTLDTRVSRARRRLYDALNGPLRAEAAALGLALDEARGEGWVETRLWCARCGTNHLQGAFMSGEAADGGPNLHLRCPACARRHGQDTLHTMGLVALGSASSFRPAWKRAMQGLTEQMVWALQVGERACWTCGGVAKVEMRERADQGDGVYPYFVQIRCAQCGSQEDLTGDYPSVDQLAAWSNPVARRFLLEHERWTSAFAPTVERDGALVVPITLQDAASAARLTVLADRQTLRTVALA